MASNFQVQVFNAIDRQINEIDRQINAIDSQFPAIDSQFPEIYTRINAIDKQINDMDTQIKATKKNEKKELKDQKKELIDEKKELNNKNKRLDDQKKELNDQRKGLIAQKVRLQEKLFSQIAKWVWDENNDHCLLNSLNENTWIEYNRGDVVHVFKEVPTGNRDGILIYDEERRLYGYITNSRTFFGEQSIDNLNENINDKSRHGWFPKGHWEVSPIDYSSSDEDENEENSEVNDSNADILLDLDDCSNASIHPQFNLSSDQDIVQQFIDFLNSSSSSTIEIEKLSSSVLNNRLQDFIKSAANFDPSHLLSLLDKLDKHLTLRNYPESLMSSSTFEKSRDLLKKKVYSTKVDTFELNWECSSEQLIRDSLKIVRLWLKPVYFKSLLKQFNVNVFLYAENAKKIKIVYDHKIIKHKSHVGWSHVKRRIAGVKNRTIYLSPLFRELAENYKETNKDEIYRRVVFLQATCICHELGHLFIRWRLDSKLNKLEKESKMSTDQFNSPPQYSEAGNFIENRLFGGSPFAYLNKDCNKILGVGMFQLEKNFKVAKQICEKFIKNLFDMSQGNGKLDPLPLLLQVENVRRNHLKRKMFGEDDNNDFGDSVNELVNITPILRIPICSNDRNLLRKYVFKF